MGGHAYPGLIYYRPELEVFPLPASPVASTRSRLEPREAVAAINGLYDRGYRRVWLARWQPRLADPLGVVERLLLDQQPRLTVGRCFHGIDLLLFGLEHRLPEEPAMGRRREAVFGQAVELVGYDPPTGEAQPGGELGLSLYWRAVWPVGRDLTAFTHLENGQGRLVSQHDRQLGGDLYPTSLWPIGQTFQERYVLAVPQAPAPLRLVVGVYDARTGERLALPDGRDQLVLETYP